MHDMRLNQYSDMNCNKTNENEKLRLWRALSDYEAASQGCGDMGKGLAAYAICFLNHGGN